MADKVFVELGFDLDNNRFGFGRSVEIEHDDGTEERIKSSMKLQKGVSYYLRLWLGQMVIIMDSQKPHLSVKKKKRNNFKVVVGKQGARK